MNEFKIVYLTTLSKNIIFKKGETLLFSDINNIYYEFLTAFNIKCLGYVTFDPFSVGVGVGVLVLLAEAFGVFAVLVPGVAKGVACIESEA